MCIPVHGQIGKRRSKLPQTVFTPYDECEHFMDGCDVMLDQLYSYSPGLNALYAMSKGIEIGRASCRERV